MCNAEKLEIFKIWLWMCWVADCAMCDAKAAMLCCMVWSSHPTSDGIWWCTIWPFWKEYHTGGGFIILTSLLNPWILSHVQKNYCASGLNECLFNGVKMLWFADWSNPVGCKQFPPGSSSVCRVHWSETWDWCWPNRARSTCKGLGGGDDQSFAAIVGSCCEFVIRT